MIVLVEVSRAVSTTRGSCLSCFSHSSFSPPLPPPLFSSGTEFLLSQLHVEKQSLHSTLRTKLSHRDLLRYTITETY